MVSWFNRDDLTPDEKEAIWYYFQFNAKMSSFLRESKINLRQPYDKRLHDNCKNLDSALNKTVLASNCMLYRGLSGDYATRILEKSMNGSKLIHESSFSSWSHIFSAAKEWALFSEDNFGVILSIEAKAGEHILNIESYDEEVIYPRRSIWRIVGKRIIRENESTVTLIALKRYNR